MSRFLLNNFISQYNNGIKLKKVYLNVKYNKLIIQCLNVLYLEGYIRGFKIDKTQYKCVVFLKYINNNNLIFFKNFASVKNLKYVSKFYIFNLVNKGFDGLISTSKGVMLCSHASRFSIGGVLLFLFK